MITTLIFDWGGIFTVGEHTPVWVGFLEKKYKLNNVRPQIEDLIAAMDTDKISFKKYCATINKRFNINTNEKEMKDFFAKAIKPDIAMLKLFKSIKNYKLLMLSNNNYPNVECIKENYPEMLTGFEKIYFSNELKLSKPNLKIYQHVIKDSKLKPEECIFIDDNKENITASKKLGMSGIWFQDMAGFKKEMSHLGINLSQK